MTIDVPARRLDYRPTAKVDTSEALKMLLRQVAEEWPDNQPVRHRAFGTWGVVHDDSPANVPYLFDGKPARVCVGPGGEIWVSVVWQPYETVPLRAWAPVRYLRRATWR